MRQQIRRTVASLVICLAMLVTYADSVACEQLPIYNGPPLLLNYTVELPPDPPTPPTYPKKRFKITAYTGIDAGQDGRDITASGTKATAYKTLAASREYPFGTILVDCETGQRYEVEDRGGAIRGDVLDLFVGHSNTRDALKWGVRYKEFYVIYPKTN